MSSVFLFGLYLVASLAASDVEVAAEGEAMPALIRRQLLAEDDCKVNPVGGNSDFDNPSNVAMAMVYIDGTDADEKFKQDFGNSSDDKADGNWAMKWCKAVFGSASYPMSPSTADRLTAMKSLCKEKGSNEYCYFGMYRPIDDITDTNTPSSACSTLQDHDGTFSFDPEDLDLSHPNGLGGSWTNPSIQPTCQWYDSTHALYETSPSRENEQCLQWRPATDKYHMQNCNLARHIICFHPTTNAECNVPAPAIS